MSDDLINRSDAIGAITNHCENECYYRADPWCLQCQRGKFEEAIDNIPSADRPQGEWLWQLADNGWADHICSVCGYTKNTDIHVSLNWSYCPNCGARMKGVNNE